MMALVVRIVRGVGDHFTARASEWALGAILIGWGYILSLPRETFHDETFEMMARLAPEWLWALAAILAGTFRILALLVNGTFQDTGYSRWSPHVRAGMALVSCFFWLQIALSFLVGNPTGQGLAVYPILLALDFFNAYRASRDAWLSDEGMRNGRRR